MTPSVLANNKGGGHRVRVSAVTKALKEIPGVADAKVEIGTAVVTYDPDKATVEAMKAAVAEEGYEVVRADT